MFFFYPEWNWKTSNEQSIKIKIIATEVFFQIFLWLILTWYNLRSHFDWKFKNMPTFPISKNHSSKAAFSQLFYVIHNIWGKTSKHCTGLLLNIQSLTWWGSITWKKYSWMLWTEAGGSSIWIILKTFYLFGQLNFFRHF